MVPAANPQAIAAALARLAGDRELLLRRGEAAYRRYTARFTAAAMPEGLERLYTRLYNEKKRIGK